MKDYTNIIKDNAKEFNDAEALTDFIDNYASDTKDSTELEDDIAEQADSLVPIYYHDIVKEWQENNEARGKAIEECGEYSNKGDIYKMMQEDLYFFYDSRLREDYNTYLSLLED